MKKGDARRAQIINKAEELFYAQGYEQTSVQQILDALKLSKGGFYHHFESKLEVLQAICDQEAARDGARLEEALKRFAGRPVDQLNALFDTCQLLRSDRMDFAALMIVVAYRGRSWQLLSAHREAVMAAALPHMNEIVRQGVKSGEFYSRFPDEIGGMILRLFFNVCDDACFALARYGQAADLSDLLSRIEAYRSGVEALLGAPFGSVTLMELKNLPAAAEAVRTREGRFSAI